MRFFLPLFFILFSTAAYCQLTIQGVVVIGESGTPVPGASVFITNTSKGVTANSEGRFQLDNVPAGKHELIISSVGYETVVHPFTETQLPLNLRVELTVKVKELSNVILEASVEEGWDKWGKTFMDHFIGNTENAARCKIKNYETIRFRYYKKSNRLIAFSDVPLIIENKALGYTINYQLEDFEVKFSEGSSMFVGYSLFQEGRDRKVWEKKREKAYRGSFMEFLRALYVDSLQQYGYEVRRMKKVRNHEKDRVKAIYRPAVISNTGGATIRVTTKPPEGKFSTDSADYYRRILRQGDFLDIYGHAILTADSLLLKKDGVYKLLDFTDYIYITYKNETEEAGYLRAKMEMRKATHQRSWVFLPNNVGVWIDRNGAYFNPQDLYTMGYLGWADKMADNLPLDYDPPN